MNEFIHGDIWKQLQCGFIIFHQEVVVVKVFVDNPKLSRAAAVPQEHLQLYLTLNLSEKTMR